MISLLRTLDPTVEPVTVDQARQHCRIDNDADDTLLATYIQAAREYAERQTNRAFLQQTWRLSLDRFPRWTHDPWSFGSRFHAPFDFACGGGWIGQPPVLLPRPRLIGINSVAYIDPSGNPQTLDPSQYIVNGDAEPAQIVPAPGTWWPATIWGRPDAVQVTYTAGYGTTAAAVPAGIQLALLGLVGHWYENRESVVLTSSTNAVTTVPQFVDALLADHTVTVFTYEVGQ